MKHFKGILQVAAICLIAITLFSCKKEKYHFNEGYVFGTVYHFTYLSDRDLQQDIEKELKKFDLSLSTFNDKSTISKINTGTQKAFYLGDDIWALNVFKKSLEFSEMTDGAFDITVAPLVNAWGFGFDKKENVTESLIDSILQFTGYRLVSIKNDTLYKTDTRIMLDASAIAKGYSCDVVADLLESKGIKNYLIEIGGEMAIKGINPKGETWKIGISTPTDDSTSLNNDWQEKLTITDKCVATSGNYRKYYIKDGKKYAHTIDPKSGYPVQHSVLSATVIANDCLTADALATAFMVMGVEKAQELAEKLPDVDAMFLCSGDSNKTVVKVTSNMSKYMLK